MAILTLQKRLRELGRIRMGVQTPTGRTGKNGQPTFRPEKLDRFRITSASRPLLEKVATLYGGEVQDWDNGGAAQFEVTVTATRLPVFVPPQPVSQYFELWSGGGCQRRCDGETELLKDQPCPCGPDPEQRKCKPTTRLNVILRDIEGIGVWRLESHGYYSAVELPDVAEFLARAGGYVSAWLSMEQRTAIRDGQTRHWMVPTLEVDVTPAELLAGNSSPSQIESGPPKTLSSGPAALSAGRSGMGKLSVDEIDMARNQIAAAVSLDQLREIWGKFTEHFVMPPELRTVFETRAGAFKRTPTPESTPVAVDALWMEALSVAPEKWSTSDLEKHFSEIVGVDPATATAEDMRRYLDIAYPAAALDGAS